MKDLPEDLQEDLREGVEGLILILRAKLSERIENEYGLNESQQKAVQELLDKLMTSSKGGVSLLDAVKMVSEADIPENGKLVAMYNFGNRTRSKVNVADLLLTI